MKKILLTITLVLGLNQSIQPSFFSKAFQSIKTTFTPGNVFTYTVIPTGAYYFASQDVAAQLGGTQAQLNQLTQSLDGLVGKKESSWLDSLGTTGAIIGGTLTAYRYLQYGISEFSSFMQIMAIWNSIRGSCQSAHGHEQKPEEEVQEDKVKGPRMLRPA